MTTKAELIRLNKENPTWNARQLAEALGCLPQYVHKCKELYGLKIPRSDYWVNKARSEREAVAQRAAAQRKSMAIVSG